MERKLGLASFLFSSKAQYFDAIAKGAYSGVMFKLKRCTNRRYDYDYVSKWITFAMLTPQPLLSAAIK